MLHNDASLEVTSVQKTWLDKGEHERVTSYTSLLIGTASGWGAVEPINWFAPIPLSYSRVKKKIQVR